MSQSYTKIHALKGYIQTTYLVEYPDKLLLLDSGCSCDVTVIQDFVTQTLGRSMRELKLVAISHMHPDHSGGAKKLQKKFKLPLAADRKLSHIYSGPRGLPLYFIDVFLTLVVASKLHKKLKWVFPARRIEPNHVLKEGDSLPGFSDWSVISAPGHTNADLSFYHQDSGVCYVADNMIHRRGGYYPPYPIQYPKMYFESLQKYIDRGIRHFLLAHGGEHVVSKAELVDLQSKKSQPKKLYLLVLRSVFKRR